MVHAVLSWTAPYQDILLERTLNGSHYVFPGAYFDPGSPIASDGGIAETGATVEVTTPDGTVLQAAEVAHTLASCISSGSCAGVYRLYLGGPDLVSGGRYRLNVRTSGDERLSAETVVPPINTAFPFDRINLNRSRDTVVLQWFAAPGWRAYEVRVTTPFGPLRFFTESTTVRLAPDIRNFLAEGLPHVFLPGFRSQVTVTAVDSNYFDYYRSYNNSYTGSGIISRVNGGLGVFGAVSIVALDSVDVTAPFVEPIEGNWDLAGDPLYPLPFRSVTLYVESHASRSDQPDAISGRTTRFGSLPVLGTLHDRQVRLAVVHDRSASDTSALFIGELRGDTLTGTFGPFQVPQTYVKRTP